MMVLAVEAYCTVRKLVAASQLTVRSHQQRPLLTKLMRRGSGQHKYQVLVVYLGFPFCLSLVKRIRPQEYLAIQSSCEKWFVIFINSWCWNTLLIDDFVFRLRSLLYNLEGVANIGVIDGVADAAFYNLFGYGGMQFVQLIDPPCSNVALLRNPNVRNLLPYFDPQKITRELISLVGIYEQDGCKLQKFAVQEKIDTTAIFDSCHFWVVFETSKIDQSAYDRCYNDYLQLARHFEGDFRFAFIPTNKPTPGCLVSVYGMNKQQPTRFNLVSNGMTSLYGVPSFLDEYRSRYRPCSTIPWKPVDLYDVMASCKFWIVASVAQESDWPCVREIEKFAVYSKDNFDFGYIKGPSFGVWLFLENKLMPVLAMSDPTTCKVPAVFDIIKGQLNKVSPPPDQICDNYATTPLNDVDIAILNQKKLMDSWENWIVLQSSPFLSNYPNMYNEFKNLFNQLKGSFRFGFMPNSQFGLWMYGSNKNWPYLITSDTNDFQSERYMAMLRDLINGRGSNPAVASPLSPYVGVSQNFGGNLQPQVPANGPYYPNTGGWNHRSTPQVDLYGSRSLESSSTDDSNALTNKIHTENAVTASRNDSKNCNKSESHDLGENNVYDVARELDEVQISSTDDGVSEEFILEPVLNLTAFPEKWKAGLDELFSKSKDLVVRVSFPYPNRRKKTETKDQAKPKLDADRAVDALPDPPPTSAISETTLYSGSRASTIDAGISVNMLTPDGQTVSMTTEPPASLATYSLIKQDTEGVTVLPSWSVNQDDLNPSFGAREVRETTTETITTSVGGETETSATTAEISTEASSTVSMDMSSQSQPPETSIATAERSADAVDVISESSIPAETATETSISTDSSVSATTELSISADGGSSASGVTEAVITEVSPDPSDGAAMAISETTNSGARDVGVESTVATESESTTPDPTTAESTTQESTIAETTTPESTTAESTPPESTTAESTAPESTTAESTALESSITELKEPTSESTTEATQVESTSRSRIIETTDVETVRKDCKFWVLISSSETKETDEKYETCYEKLTGIMNNYKNMYKFGAVQTGEFFINLYLRNKSNPIAIATDYSCDEKQIKSALDAHLTENPGEFCQDPEDGSNLSTTSEPVTLATLSTRPTSTVAPDCSLQLVVRYPKKDAKKYQSCLGELSKVINSKEAKWLLKEEDKPAFGVLLWTTTGVKPLMNLKLADCKVDAIQKSINNVVTTSTPMCAYARG